MTDNPLPPKILELEQPLNAAFGAAPPEKANP